MLPKLKLTYFDFDGGRGEAARLALALSNVPFNDERVSRERFLEMKNTLPYGALPVLWVDGQPIAQSNAICRYIGKLTDMYPSQPLQAALCDEILDTVEEITMTLGSTMALPEEEKKQRRIKLMEDTLPVLLRGLAARLQMTGAPYFNGAQLGVADLKLSDLTQWLCSGILDHIPTDFVQRTAPALAEHCERTKNDPRIKSYYAKRQSLAKKP